MPLVDQELTTLDLPYAGHERAQGMHSVSPEVPNAEHVLPGPRRKEEVFSKSGFDKGLSELGCLEKELHVWVHLEEVFEERKHIFLGEIVPIAGQDVHSAGALLGEVRHQMVVVPASGQFIPPLSTIAEVSFLLTHRFLPANQRPRLCQKANAI